MLPSQGKSKYNIKWSTEWSAFSICGANIIHEKMKWTKKLEEKNWGKENRKECFEWKEIHRNKAKWNGETHFPQKGDKQKKKNEEEFHEFTMLSSYMRTLTKKNVARKASFGMIGKKTNMKTSFLFLQTPQIAYFGLIFMYEFSSDPFVVSANT